MLISEFDYNFFLLKKHILRFHDSNQTPLVKFYKILEYLFFDISEIVFALNKI